MPYVWAAGAAGAAGAVCVAVAGADEPAEDDDATDEDTCMEGLQEDL